jgi:ABC-type oligopeptide transport system substrate-binding subunit
MRRTVNSVAMFATGGVLLAASAVGGPSAAPGGTFRWSMRVDIDYVDPALAYYGPSWALEYATGATLFSYPDAPAPRGTRLIPEVAAGLPAISKDGKTYTFTLKRTYRFSHGRQVRAAHFARAFDRALNRRMASPAESFADDIVGADEVIGGEAQSVRGVQPLGRYKLRIQLKKRAADFLARVAMPFFMAVPIKMPIEPGGIEAPVASAGPYFIKKWERNRRVVLERNRFYRGPRPHRVDRIEVDIGLPSETIKLNIDRGVTDIGDVPPSAHAELGRRHGVKRRSPGRYFVNPTGSIRYLALNHDRPLFGGPNSLGNVRLKKAINFAIDRRTMMRQYGSFGGSVHDQLLPPTMRGFKDVALYPRRPNLVRARQLAEGALRHAKGDMYCGRRAPEPAVCQVVQANLREIGLEMDILLFPVAGYQDSGRRGEPFDIDVQGWHMDYFDPYDFIFLVDGTTIRPANNTNLSYFNDARYNRMIQRASSLVGEARYAAFSRLDEELMRTAAPVAVFGVPNDRHYVSARTGCYHHQPVYGLDLPALCLRR